jgi:hypothetical protein
MLSEGQYQMDYTLNIEYRIRRRRIRYSAVLCFKFLPSDFGPLSPVILSSDIWDEKIMVIGIYLRIPLSVYAAARPANRKFPAWHR